MDPNDVRTIATANSREADRIKGSRFIGDAARAADEETAAAFVEKIRSREFSASHHCWAYRLSDGRERSSDDGEPGGTAGPPILRRIHGADLKDLIVVVTRYYGGTNLGRGGLRRAYGAAAAAVLNEASVVVRPLLETLRVAHTYEHSAAVSAAIARHEGVVIESSYGEVVELAVAVPSRHREQFVGAVSESTGGQVVPVRQ